MENRISKKKIIAGAVLIPVITYFVTQGLDHRYNTHNNAIMPLSRAVTGQYHDTQSQFPTIAPKSGVIARAMIVSGTGIGLLNRPINAGGDANVDPEHPSLPDGALVCVDSEPVKGNDGKDRVQIDKVVTDSYTVDYGIHRWVSIEFLDAAPVEQQQLCAQTK